MDSVKQIKLLLREAEIYRVAGLPDKAREKYRLAENIINSNPQLKNSRKLSAGIAKKIETLEQPAAENGRPDPDTPVQSSIRENITCLLREAALYSSQGLLTDAVAKYRDAFARVEKNVSGPDGQKLLADIAEKIDEIEARIQSVQDAPVRPELPGDKQKLIKRLFSFAENEDPKAVAELSGAIALARFGQYQRAVDEFDKMLAQKNLRLVAAKNIFRCHMAMGSPAKALEQYEKWCSENLFSPRQVDHLNAFLSFMAGRQGVALNLPESGQPSGKKAAGTSDAEFLDISSVGITLQAGEQKGRAVELDVNYQNGNTVSFIVSSKDHALIDYLDIGLKLEDIQFYSPIAIFKGAGVICGKTQIGGGPKKGDYSLDIKIVSI